MGVTKPSQHKTQGLVLRRNKHSTSASEIKPLLSFEYGHQRAGIIQMRNLEAAVGRTEVREAILGLMMPLSRETFGLEDKCKPSASGILSNAKLSNVVLVCSQPHHDLKIKQAPKP